MKIQKQPTSVTITLSPKEYYIVKNENEQDFYGEYALAHRIDMSYCGKEDQVGATVMFLREDEVKHFRDAGFTEVEIL